MAIHSFNLSSRDFVSVLLEEMICSDAAIWNNDKLIATVTHNAPMLFNLKIQNLEIDNITTPSSGNLKEEGVIYIIITGYRPYTLLNC